MIDYVKRAKSQGYTVVSQSSLNPANIWVWAGDGRQVLKDFTEHKERRKPTGMPAVHFENELGSEHKYVRFDGKKAIEPICLENYACEEGRDWPGYVQKEDGTEGPAPFRGKKDRLAYENHTGLRQLDPGEGDNDPRLNKKLKPKRRKV